MFIFSSTRTLYRIDLRVFRRFSNLSNPRPTINEAELSRFRNLSSKWWIDREWLPLRNLNTLRVPFIVSAYNGEPSSEKGKRVHNLTGIKLLDIGCGGGILSEPLARIGANVTGIDPVEESIQVARLHATVSFRHNLQCIPTYKCTSIEQLSDDPANQGAFDGVIASEVIEHVENVPFFLGCALKCLRPGGTIFITTQNQTPLAYFSVILVGEYLTDLIPRGTHEYDKFVSPSVLSRLLKDYNCDVAIVQGTFFNPLTLQWSWTENQWINYALRAIKRV